MITEEYIFVSASTYEMVKKETGEILRGTTVYLLPLKGANDDNLNGAKPQKFNQPLNSFKAVYSKLNYLQKYNFVFETRASGTGVKLVLSGLSQPQQKAV